MTYRGKHLDVEDAKLFDRPEEPVQIGGAVSGRSSCEIAGELDDFVIAVEPKSELIEMFHEPGAYKPTREGQWPN